MMKKMDKKAFTLIELIVVIAIIGILVLLGIPRFIGHTQKAELTRIQHDIKVMEQEVGTEFINNDDDFDNWENNDKDFNQLIQEGKLFEKEGVAVDSIDGTYKVIPEKYKDKINTKLKGTFYANSSGKVYYEHTKSLSGIPSEPGEKGPEYSDEEIQDLIKNNFIPVATADELNSIRNNTERTYGKGTEWEGKYTGGLDKHYVQVAKIDLSGYSGGEGWTPIGTTSASFTGTYDGGNYVITDLEINGEDYQGLFGHTQKATISNVGLIGNKVTGNDSVGGLVGFADYSMINNSYATGVVKGTSSVGGLVGYATSSTEISNSYATGAVTGGNQVGGLVGSAIYEAKISNSYTTSSVEGKDYTGGLVGWANDNTKISNSYATGSVTGSSKVGGLVGRTYTGTEISNSYFTGDVKGSGDDIGGLVGQAFYTTIENSYFTGSVTGAEWHVGGFVGDSGYSTVISNSYSTGTVTGSRLVGGLVGVASSWDMADGSMISNSYVTGSVKGEGSVGGLVGYVNSEITIENSYWNTETTGQSTSVGGEGKSTEDMKKKETYLNEVSNWDFDTVWEITPGNYPTLR